MNLRNLTVYAGITFVVVISFGDDIFFAPFQYAFTPQSTHSLQSTVGCDFIIEPG